MTHSEEIFDIIKDIVESHSDEIDSLAMKKHKNLKDDTEAICKEIIICIKKKEYFNAIALCHYYLRLNPGNYHLWHMLAKSLDKISKKDLALKSFIIAETYHFLYEQYWKTLRYFYYYYSRDYQNSLVIKEYYSDLFNEVCYSFQCLCKKLTGTYPSEEELRGMLENSVSNNNLMNSFRRQDGSYRHL